MDRICLSEAKDHKLKYYDLMSALYQKGFVLSISLVSTKNMDGYIKFNNQTKSVR